jgi:hypothetical protein
MKNIKAMVRYISVLWLALFWMSCNANKTSDESYDYIGYDINGIKTIEGILTIEQGDSTDISCNWDFSAIGNPQNIGPQIGKGTGTGFIDDISFYANLNPNYADNNVMLVGTIDGNTIQGEWTFAGFPGVINSGTFVAQN